MYARKEIHCACYTFGACGLTRPRSVLKPGRCSADAMSDMPTTSGYSTFQSGSSSFVGERPNEVALSVMKQHSIELLENYGMSE